MRLYSRILLSLPVLGLVIGCVSSDENSTLYRNSITDENIRIHVASFDAADGEPYNRGNCDQAQLLFQAQPGVKTKFWCEKGAFKK